MCRLKYVRGGGRGRLWIRLAEMFTRLNLRSGGCV